MVALKTIKARMHPKSSPSFFTSVSFILFSVPCAASYFTARRFAGSSDSDDGFIGDILGNL
jgi:hypothetical protein